MSLPVEEPQPLDRRSRRRLETIEEILDIAEALMTEEGVNGLTLSEVARRLGVQPPSLYKYFPSLMAVYDALFERGQRVQAEHVLAAVAAAPPGLPALVAGLEAGVRWGLEHQGMAQLMFWRPAPSFTPSEQAMAPALAQWEAMRAALTDAVRLGHLGPGADSDEALHVGITLIAGVFATTASNEPHLPWGTGRFMPLFPKLMELFPTLYPPTGKPRRRH